MSETLAASSAHCSISETRSYAILLSNSILSIIGSTYCGCVLQSPETGVKMRGWKQHLASASNVDMLQRVEESARPSYAPLRGADHDAPSLNVP